MIVLDASVLIAHLDDRDAHHRRARDLLVEMEAEDLGASTITLAETLVAPARAGVLDAAIETLAMLRVDEIPLGDDAAAELARLRADTDLKLPDCCVLLTAARNGALATFDRALAAAAARLGIETRG